jgi:hypothetical protein
MGTITSALEDATNPNPIVQQREAQESQVPLKQTVPAVLTALKPVQREFEPPPPIPANRTVDKKAHLLKEIEAGLDALGDRELSAWICHANSSLDKSIVQRARRELMQVCNERPHSIYLQRQIKRSIF